MLITHATDKVNVLPSDIKLSKWSQIWRHPFIYTKGERFGSLVSCVYTPSVEKCRPLFLPGWLCLDRDWSLGCSWPVGRHLVSYHGKAINLMRCWLRHVKYEINRVEIKNLSKRRSDLTRPTCRNSQTSMTRNCGDIFAWTTLIFSTMLKSTKKVEFFVWADQLQKLLKGRSIKYQ